MAIADLLNWMDEFGRPGIQWYVKRLAANDTLASNAHQAGPYVPRKIIFDVLPELNRGVDVNPDTHFDLHIDSHNDVRRIRAIWYNGVLHGTSTRNETRLTGFGGASSALLDPDNTGALVVFAFLHTDAGPVCHVWVCSDPVEEGLVEDRIGPVEPKQHVVWSPGQTPVELQERISRRTVAQLCWLSTDEIPPAWLEKFPTGLEIVAKALERCSGEGMNPDRRLLRRRDCEFEMFRSVEEAFWMPRVISGFLSIDSFIGIAQSILQSRKSRSGRSLEYQIDMIFGEEGLVPGENYVHGASIEGNKRPDFLFPNLKSYMDGAFPQGSLRMMAVKTTCKDRWRQILNEADRVPVKHLLTLQEGVSENQFAEMKAAGVKLIVPARLHKAYPKAIRPHLQTIHSFVREVRGLSSPNG